MIQEAGRCLRGSQEETQGLRGFAFFFQKGSVAAIHCPPGSDCRSLVTDPLPVCQSKNLYRYFDPDFDTSAHPCNCCYACISRHVDHDCQDCVSFLETYIPKKVSRISYGSVRKGLKLAILDLFLGMGISEIKVESRLYLDVDNFASDFVKVFDEIDKPSDIMDLWHLPQDIAEDIYAVSQEFISNGSAEDIEFQMETDGEENSFIASDSSSNHESSYDYESSSDDDNSLSSDSIG